MASRRATNADVAALFLRYADLLDIQRANPFRVRAYRNAARTVSGLGRELADMLAEGADLTELPGIGDDLAGKIAEIVATGHLRALDTIGRKMPAGLADLLALPGLGPRRVALLHDRLKIGSIADLRAALAAGRMEGLNGLGPKTVARIAAALASAPSQRTLWTVADDVARRLRDHLAPTVGLKRLEIAGSYRRQCETVGDLDVLAISRTPAAVIDRFVAFPGTAKIAAKGTTRAAIVLDGGLQVDLRVVAPESFGAALVYFTGSKAHNLALRRRGLARGLKINEYGVFKGRHRVAGRSEAEVYAAVGLAEIPPELREGGGELEAAAESALPRLIARGDLKGDLHVHTDATDGTASLEAMVEAARAAGLDYIAVTDHSVSLRVAHGLDARRLRKQVEAIARLNGRLSGFTVLASAEVDILPDGRLDLPDEVLRDLDLVVAAIHSSFELPRAAQTERVLRALDHPHCTILAHPTGRMIGSRKAVDLDLDRILRAAKARGAVMEVNSQPVRLDLSDADCRRAKALGVKLAISSDAHGPRDFGLLARGVAQARRGWLGAADVINTLPLGKLRAFLRRP
jgi:DNA polymerase (family 10)